MVEDIGNILVPEEPEKLSGFYVFLIELTELRGSRGIKFLI